MHPELRRLLTEFSLEELPRMSNAEIMARIEALRELGDASHYLWRLPARYLTTLVQTKGLEGAEQNGRASFSVCLLEEELRARRGVKQLENAL
jgi:hypothetical protein